MNLSPKGRRAILCSNMAFCAWPCGLAIPAELVSTSTHNVLWMAGLLIGEVGLAFVCDLTFARVVRQEVPDYPLKSQQYTPAQTAYVQSSRRRVLAKWPYFIIGFILFLSLMSQGHHLDDFITWLLTLPMASCVLVAVLLSVIGGLGGMALGKYLGDMRIRRARELMAA